MRMYEIEKSDTQFFLVFIKHEKINISDLFFILINLYFLLIFSFIYFLNPFLNISTHILKCALSVIILSHKNMKSYVSLFL